MSAVRKDPRHRAREAALQILYQWEIGKRDIDKSSTTFFELQWPNVDPPPDDLRLFATTLARDTTERLSEIDPLIADGHPRQVDPSHGRLRDAPRRVDAAGGRHQ